MRSIGEFFYLPLLSLVVKLRSWKEERYVAQNYYTDTHFKQTDLALKSAYKNTTPFELSKEFLIKRGEKEVYAYGETPLSALETIGAACDLKASDHLIDLGCGTGRGLFFLAYRFGCTATGVDWVPQFVETGNRIAQEMCPNVTFIRNNILKTDLSQASAIYLYGTCLAESTIFALIQKFKQLPKAVKIITVSYSLSEYDSSNSFSTDSELVISFPWGKTSVFIQKIN